MNKICKNCSASNLEQARFCAKCGSALQIDRPTGDHIREQTPAEQATEATKKAKIQAGKLAAKTKYIWANLIIGEKVMAIGALVTLIAFFLPWFSVSGKYINGPKAGSDAWYIYLLPLSILVSLALIYFTQGATINRKVLIARWQIIIGTLWGSIFLFLAITIQSIISALKQAMGGFSAFLGAGSLGANLSVGIYLIVASAITIIVGAFMLQAELLRDNKEKG